MGGPNKIDKSDRIDCNSTKNLINEKRFNMNTKITPNINIYNSKFLLLYLYS